jgi:hypothetical protein
MKFRPCIDIHNGKVKQIVGGSLKDEGDMAQTNFTSEQDAAWYAEKYKQEGISFCSIPEIPNILRQRKRRRFWRFRYIREGCRSAAVSRRKMRKNIWMQAPAM